MRLTEVLKQATLNLDAECRRKLDAIFKTEPPPLSAPSLAPPTPGPVLPTEMPQESSPEEAARGILHEPPSPINEPTSDEEEARPAAIARAVEEAKGPADRLFAAVTRQLSRAEIMGREDALKAIQKEFDDIGAMGAWKLESVREEADVREEALGAEDHSHCRLVSHLFGEERRLRAIKEIIERQSVLSRRRSQGRERQSSALSIRP